MRALGCLVLAIAQLTACGRLGFDPPDDADSLAPPPLRWTDGTRLRARRTLIGTIETFAGWYDTQLQINCKIVRASDGVLRCLPIDPVILDTFADPSCTTLVATRGTPPAACPSLATFALDYFTHAVFRTGPGFTGQLYGGGSCATRLGAQIPEEYFEIGASEPLTTFVAAVEVTSRHQRLSYIEYVAEDGARELQPEMFDHERNERCHGNPFELGERRCTPTLGTYPVELYGDAGCTRRVVIDSEPVARRGFIVDDTLCTHSTRIVERGAPVGTVYSRNASTNACAPYALPTTYAAFDMGDDVTDEYARMTPFTVGTGRIRELRWTAGGVELPDFTFQWDATMNVGCRSYVDNISGIASCIPAFADPTTVFMDAACTTVGGLVVSSCRYPAAAIAYPPLGATQATCLGLGWDIVLYSADPGLATAYEWVNDACVMIDQTAHPLRREDFTPFDPSAFVPATLAP